MAIKRIYTGDGGESQMQEINLDDHPELESLHDADGVEYLRFDPDFSSD